MARKYALLLVAATFLPLVLIAQARADDGCARCENVAKVLKSLRCEACKPAAKACEKCATSAKALAEKAGCMDCVKGGACKGCAAIKDGACGFCEAKKQLSAKLYCCSACESSKPKDCAKCLAKRKPILAIGCAACAAKAPPGQTVVNNEVTIVVTKVGPMKTEDGTVVKGFYQFKVVAKNANKSGKKTVNGRVDLLDAKGQSVGGCTVYLPIAPGKSAEKVFNAKFKGEWSSFKMVIKKVYDF